MKSPNLSCHKNGYNTFCVKIVLSLILAFLSSNLFSQQLAFPSAEGFGRFASGGRGGIVIRVTNLNNSGPGSLRAALEANGTRTVVFEVGGTIDLSGNNIYIAHGNLTVAGQTAPGDGILIKGGMVQVEASNVIIRYIRFRPGSTANTDTDGLSITAWSGKTVSDIIVDHCSISWAKDENFDIRAVGSGMVSDITIQYSIISECNKGALAGQRTYNKTYYKNLFANNFERNIRTNFPNPGTFDFEMINNLVYAFKWPTVPSLGSKFTVLNNKYKASSQVAISIDVIVDGEESGQGTVSETYAYISGNILAQGTQQNDAVLNQYLHASPYSDSGIVPISASQIEADILSNVGASLPSRDAVDTRIINQYIAGNGTLANTGVYPNIQGGTAPVDTDNDGMPDYWEVANGLDIDNPNDRNVVQADGYTNLEYYLNGMSLQPTGIIANAGQDQTICEGSSTTLTATGGSTYEWSTGETTASITVSPDATTIYTVTAYDATGTNSDTDDVTVTVSPLPIANAGDDVSTCLGTSVTLTASGGTNYLWNTGATTQSITVNPTATTTYSVEVTQNACSSTDEVVVTVNPIPTIDAGQDVTINLGESVTLTASGGNSYSWSTGDNTQSITVNPTMTTTYTVTGFLNGCEATDTVTIFLVDNSVIANAGQDQTICEGSSTTLTATGGSTYEWSTGETTASITVSPDATTIYTVTAYDATGTNSDTDDVTVTVSPLPIANAGDDVSTCLGTSVTLTASGGTNYLWNTGATTQSITVNPTATTTYSVEVTQNACSSTDEVVVTVNPIPTIDAGQDVTINLGESVTLTASGGNSYSWSTGDNTQSITVNPTMTTTYTVTGFLNGCEATDTVTVFVGNETINANAGEDETTCQGYGVTLTASGGDSYLWSTGETTASIIVTPNSTTTYTVTVFAGNLQDTDDVTVFVNPNPNVIITNGTDATILAGEFITLSATGANSYHWSNGANQPNIAVSPNATTTYAVTGYINNCSDEKQITVSVLQHVDANAGDDVTTCVNEPVTLTATGTGGDEYLWSTGETTQSITVNPLEDTEYSVMIYNALDYDTDEVMVFVNECDAIETPVEPTEFEFLAYPNPTSGELNVKISGLLNVSQIYIFDISGKALYNETISDNEQHTYTKTLNLSNYATGIYLLKLVDNTNVVTKKIVVR
ncbi:MAG: T9SS type A sorting domain-containing protein [Gelidibacter sp.]